MADAILSQTEAAYLAGLLDGEGYFGIVLAWQKPAKPGYTLRPYWRCFIDLVMTNKPLLDEIAGMITWSKRMPCRETRKLRGRAKQSWCISWSAQAAFRICEAIQPYARLKQPHIALLLSLRDAKLRAEPERGRGMGRPYPDWVNDLHAEAYKQFRILNQRGQDNACKVESATKPVRGGTLAPAQRGKAAARRQHRNG